MGGTRILLVGIILLSLFTILKYLLRYLAIRTEFCQRKLFKVNKKLISIAGLVMSKILRVL